MTPRPTIVLFTRDLRVHDHPALAEAVKTADHVLPLFVLDDAILDSRHARPNRLKFLVESLADLDASLREARGRLIVRRGEVVREVMTLAGRGGARALFLGEDVTGYPLVDAGMRQLARQGWMHNRARLVTASFLVKDLYLDWRLGAAHFFDWLVDGDIANNAGNWQWVAGTGNDTRPNRVFNPVRQAERFDPDGDYVRHWLPELASVPGGRVHEPWRLDVARRRRLDYPDPIVDHGEAATAFHRRRRRAS